MTFQEVLSDENFEYYAIKNYTNSQFMSYTDFEEDLNRIKYVKRLLSRYKQKDILKERLIINHIIILQNTFGALPTCRMLFFKLEVEYHSYIKPFLEYLNYLPEYHLDIPEINILDIPSDLNIVKRLKEMRNHG